MGLARTEYVVLPKSSHSSGDGTEGIPYVDSKPILKGKMIARLRVVTAAW